MILLLFFYLALGYLTTAIQRVPVTGVQDPMLPLPPAERTVVSGVFSVHTGRSHDARGTRDQVAEAAEQAGLDFVVIGDHPPAPERPDWALWEPTFMEGVLLSGGVELRGPRPGKVLAMGLDSTFRRWEGSMESFVAFLDRQEATTMIVHGRGPRESERWEHDRILGFDGWEVLDVSEAARARLQGVWGPYHLLTFLVGLPLGFGDEALLHLMREGFDTPAAAAYDSLRVRGPLTATAGLNVHPKLALGPILVPSYGPFLRTLVSHVVVDRPFSEDAREARDLLAAGIRRGNVFISMGSHPAVEEFWSGVLLPNRHATDMGAEAVVADTGFLRAGFRGSWLQNTVYRIVRDGREVAWVLDSELEWPIPGPGHYRVEVYRYGARVGNVFFRLRPWIFANPVVVLEVAESR